MVWPALLVAEVISASVATANDVPPARLRAATGAGRGAGAGREAAGRLGLGAGARVSAGGALVVSTGRSLSAADESAAGICRSRDTLPAAAVLPLSPPPQAATATR